MDPFQLLKKDHKKVSDLLKRLDKTEESDASKREELFAQVKNELEIHTQIEEKIFYPLANKCNTCHAIKADAIEKTSKTKMKKEPPDLSTIGDQKTADWIVKYLKKQEMLDNAKHVKAWTGKEEDLQTVAKWLESHKSPAK